MWRRTDDGQVSELPALEELADDQRVYLRMMLGLAETGDMFHGRFVEAHVAWLLGAHFPTTGISGWDLWVPDDPAITVEVKGTQIGRSFSVAPRLAHVWVFVAYPEKSIRARDFQYVVAAGADVAALGRLTMSQRKLFERFGPSVGPADLATAVRAVAGGRRVPVVSNGGATVPRRRAGSTPQER